EKYAYPRGRLLLFIGMNHANKYSHVVPLFFARRVAAETTPEQTLALAVLAVHVVGAHDLIDTPPNDGQTLLNGIERWRGPGRSSTDSESFGRLSDRQAFPSEGFYYEGN